jgi:hypothetical protein
MDSETLRAGFVNKKKMSKLQTPGGSPAAG